MSIFQFFSALFGNKNVDNQHEEVQKEEITTEEVINHTYAALATFADKEANEGKFILFGLIVHGDEEFVPIGFRFRLEVEEDEFHNVELNRSYPITIKEKQVMNIRWNLVN
ncbi:hypothetical protein [Lysinibacillus fusiformis]|uniref:hypothetical protein n=1 Tax=Lysinibacillus fusiformis TaxID=28031 RepID=UPI0018803771|nr:hypothetical protein [Lysinibacillus fusiformis]MBD8523894.1 hypothetical protein [Lysinibacillus fusiformis]